MKDNYKDILTLTMQIPTWWDLFGAPRYGAPPEDMLPGMRWIKCQECHRKFWVCLVDCYHDYQGVGFDGEHFYEKYDMPDDWHYGDPPFHCQGLLGPDDVCYAGYTMNSIPEWEWEDT